MRFKINGNHWLRAVIVFSLTLPILIGCGGIHKSRKSEFLTPLASSQRQKAKTQNGPMPSERTLCLETAKTVAEQGHAAEAIKLYERAEELAPTEEPCDAEIAPLYADVGNLEAAIQRYQRCIERSPNDTELSNNFAWTLMESERFDQAIHEANRGLQTDPSNVRLQSTLAMVYYRKGDRAAALKHFEQAHGSTAAHHNLAILDIDAGNLDAAKANLQIAKQSSQPNSKTELLISAIESQDPRR